MGKIYLLIISLLIQTNSQIKNNPIFLVNKSSPFVVSSNDSYYYVLTEGKNLKINKEYGNIENITYFTQTSSKYFYVKDNKYNNYKYFQNKYYKINYNQFISYEKINGFSQIMCDSKVISAVGGIAKNNELINYGFYNNCLIFSSYSRYHQANTTIEGIDDKLSCKLIEDEYYICVMIINQHLNIYCLNYHIYLDGSNYDPLTSYKLIESSNNIQSFGLYDTGESHVKLLCDVENQMVHCKFFKIIDFKSIELSGDDNIIFEATDYFNENNCSLSQFNNEYLFCCAFINYIKCYRINSDTHHIIKYFHLYTKNGYNSYLTIISNDNYSTFFFMNHYYNEISVFEYYIYLPICHDKQYFLLNSLNENKSEENWEKLRNLFTIKTNKYYFEIKDQIDEIGYFTLNGEKINERILIINDDYIFNFIVTKNNISPYFKKIVNYIISVEDEEAYSKECKITLIFQACYHSCQKCSKIVNDSNEEEHNCLKCKQKYYTSPENNRNCYSIEEKKINWYLDLNNSEFRFCDKKCRSCNGTTKFNCLSCSNGLYLDNNSCTLNCSEGYYPIKAEINPDYYFICNKCYQNCKTCSKGGNSQKMNCDSCKENQIKYNDSCFDIFNNSIKTFILPENNKNNISSCYEKFGLYIKEDLNECIPLTKEDEGYYISNNETGLLSKCHNNCFSCYKSPIFNNNGYLESMECILCKDSNSSQKTMIKINNNCFRIIQYNDSKIIFNISEMNIEFLGTCKYFGKAIYYGEYECIDKPINTYYILNEEQGNTGIIKNCHEACKTCSDEGNDYNTNCLECAPGYIKIEDLITNCIKNDSISLDDYYLNKIDNIYYHCYQNCKGCYNSYNSSTEDMYCLDCINGYYFIYGKNNCYNFTLLEENKYYFNFNNSRFHSCYYTCSECLNFVPNETNNFCLKCNPGYYFLENTNNCYDMNKTEEGYYLDNNFTGEKGPIFKKCYKSCKYCEWGLTFNTSTNEEIHNCKECADNYFKLENDLYPNNCYYNETTYNTEEFKLSNLTNMIENNSSDIICLNNISPDGYCVLTCPNGTYQFSLNNSCLYSCPHNYEIEKNKCIFKYFDPQTKAEEFKIQIKNDITSFVNSSKIINGSDFLAMVSTSDNINPEEQLNKGISAIDLGNCTNVIKEYYNISNEENFIILNMELKNDDKQKNENNNKDDNSFNLGKNTQLEIYDYSGKKLNLSVCKENIKILKLLGNIEQDLDMKSAKALSEQGIDVFNKNDNFFNDICHQYENPEGKDIILTDRRNDIYQEAKFCQNGCTYNGINFNLNAANCLCNSSFLQEDNITNYESIETMSNFKKITQSFISDLVNLNFDILRCYNLALNIKILLHNIGFYCLSSMFILQIIFFFIYLYKKLKPLKHYLLLFNNNKKNNYQNNNRRRSKNSVKAIPPPRNNSFIKTNNHKIEYNTKKEYIKINLKEDQENRLNNKDFIINDIHEERKFKNEKIDNEINNVLSKNALSKNILNSSKIMKADSKKLLKYQIILLIIIRKK